MWTTLVTLLALSCVAHAGWLGMSRGECPEVESLEEFHTERYMGKWFEILKPALGLRLPKCVVQEYNQTGEYSFQVSVTANFTREPKPWWWFWARPVELDVRRYVVEETMSEEDLGRVTYRYEGDDNEDDDDDEDDDEEMEDMVYWILATDYEHFSVAYSCDEFQFWRRPFHKISLWVLGRTPELSMDMIGRALNATQFGMEAKQMVKHTDQSCFVMEEDDEE